MSSTVSRAAESTPVKDGELRRLLVTLARTQVWHYLVTISPIVLVDAVMLFLTSKREASGFWTKRDVLLRVTLRQKQVTMRVQLQCNPFSRKIPREYKDLEDFHLWQVFPLLWTPIHDVIYKESIYCVFYLECFTYSYTYKIPDYPFKFTLMPSRPSSLNSQAELNTFIIVNNIQLKLFDITTTWSGLCAPGNPSILILVPL